MSHSHSRWSPERLGFVLCVVSTAFYCGSNVTLRALSDAVPHDWTLFYKELLGLAPLIPWIAVRLCQGRYARQSKRLLALVVIGGIVCELIGARFQLGAFATIGIVMSMPIIYAFTIVGTALLGLAVRDTISPRRLRAIGLLIIALSVLTLGKMMVPTTTVATSVVTTAATDAMSARWLSLVGISVAMVAGLSYAFHLTCLRLACSTHWRADDSFWDNLRWNAWQDRQYRTAAPQQGEPLSLVLAIALVQGVGVVIFGGCLYQEHGASGFLCGDVRCWWLVGVAAACSLIGFVLQVFALRLTSAAQVSLVSVLQLVILTVIGRFVFAEPVNAMILAGLSLTMLGVFISSDSGNSRIVHPTA